MVRGLDVRELARSCQEETDRYLRGEPFRESFCFELFRRAIVERDNAAWAGVYTQYASLARIWLKARMDEDEGVNAAFERFWRALDPAKFARFGSLAAVLSYLKMCVHTTVLDHLRAQRQGALEVDLEAVQTLQARDTVEGVVGARLDAAELWQRVRETLTQERERRVIYLSYAIGLTPREIHARHGGEFPHIDEIYRLKRGAIDRLRQSADLHGFFTASEPERD
jgi:DNA-directed RNA polymerase specialized sigma24 family protein